MIAIDWARVAPPGGDARSKRGVRVGAVLIGLVMSLGALAPAAGASTATGNGGPLWSDPVFDNPATSLLSVTCTSVGNCVGVGADMSTGTSVPTVAVERAGTWGAPASPDLPAGADTSAGHGGGLTSVSCTTTTACVAVGNYFTPGGSQTAMVTALTVSGDTASSSGLAPVTLPSGAADPAGAGQSALLRSVSCAAGGSCVAVGDYTDDASSKTFAMTAVPDSGGHWTASTVTPPPMADDSIALFGISCPPSGACEAVGAYDDISGVQDPWAVQVTGGVAGTGVDVTLPSDLDTTASPGAAGLKGVSCPSAGSCIAVGGYTATTNPLQAVAVPITAGVPGTAVKLTGLSGILSGVSCADVSNCSAFGTGASNVVVSEVNGMWSPLVALNGADNATTDLVFSITCPAAGTCVLSGTHADIATRTAHGFLAYSAMPLAVSPSPLPGATVGTPYATTVGTTGGTGPNVWSISAGALPAGLALDPATGAISGTPTTAGSDTFGVTVAEAGPPGQTATAVLSISVSPATARQPSTGSVAKGVHISGTTARLSVRCTGPSGSSCAFTGTETTTEHLTGKSVVGVTASTRKRKHSKKTVTVGRATAKVTAGSTATLKIPLNHKGLSLLKRFRKLPVTLKIGFGGHTLLTKHVTFRRKPKRQPKR